MKFLIAVIIVINCFCSPSSDKKKDNREYYPANKSPLENKIKTVDLIYIAWACECANWMEENEYKKYEDQGKLAENSIFLEPADSSLILADTLGYSADLIKFTGQFYTEKGYPKNYEKSEENPEPARVFRYTHYKVLRSNYRDFVDNKN
jgi:hypothetical protein